MSIKGILFEILAEKSLLSPNDIKMSDSLADLGLDSMGIIEVLFALEESLNIDLDFNLNLEQTNDFNLNTVEELLNSIEKVITKED